MTTANASAFPTPSGAASARSTEPNAGFGFFRTILKPVASLRLTVTLLVMAIVLVFCGTSAQKELGIGEVLTKYFYAWGCWIPLKYLFPLSSIAWAKLGGGFPFPGGYTIILALLANLITAHTLKFKVVKGDLLLVPLLALTGWFMWKMQGNLTALWVTLTTLGALVTIAATAVFHKKRTGVIVIHASLILLLVGELMTSVVKHEDQLRFREGDTRQWVHDVQAYEIAVVDAGAGAKGADRVTVIGDKALNAGRTIRDAALPFDVRVDQWYPNATPVGPMQQLSPEQKTQVQRLATAGAMKDVALLPMAKFTGVEAEQVDAPGAFVTLTPKEGGAPIGTYMLSVFYGDALQDVVIGGKTYGLALRLERTYLPYSLTLIDFAHDKYVGSEMARNFSSRVRVDDAAAGMSRELTIRMNEPFRYQGRTFFQQSFDPTDDKVTVLQVVDNKAWAMPYVACVIGTIGMLIHFGLALTSFLRKRASEAGTPIPLGVAGLFVMLSVLAIRRARKVDEEAKTARVPAPGGRRRSKSDDRAYTLEPNRGFRGLAIPLAIVAIFALWVLGVALKAPRAVDGKPDLYAFGQIPVSFDGRVMPLDTLARSGLKIIYNKQQFTTPDDKDITATQWLADVMAGRPEADQYRVFRIDHPDIKSMLGLDELTAASRKNWKRGDPDPLDGKNFSYENILYSRPGNPSALQKQVDAVRQVPDKRRDTYQRKVMELYSHLSLHMRLAQVGSLLELHDLWTDPKAAEAFGQEAQGLLGLDPATLTPAQKAIMSRADRVDQQVRRLRQLQQSPEARTEDLYFLPPAQAGGAWGGLGQAMIDGANGGSLEKLPAEMKTFLTLLRDYRDGSVSSFNSGVAQYNARLGVTQPQAASTAAFEQFFNRFDPFYLSLILYVFTFILVVISWTAFQAPMWRSAAGLLALALLVHTVGLIMRIMISGRPPVTNLYSSAVFIAWGAVVMATLFEIVFRNGIGFACAAVVGALSLTIAGGLATEGDTMKQLQAVLDTNFWLATHVVVITLGYAATFLAWGLAVAYLIAGMATPNLDKDLRKNLTRMVYGVMCFAMLFSFVGTILGGIWADQSWGRFWGWDPKENGAVLIVLWVAVVLHARWGGLVKERGLMILTILGGIVTAWSWFGTNMMGVGLHSYGFMESGIFWLGMFTLVDLTIVGVTLSIPQRLWWSFQAEAGDVGSVSAARGFAPLAPKPGGEATA